MVKETFSHIRLVHRDKALRDELSVFANSEGTLNISYKQDVDDVDFEKIELSLVDIDPLMAMFQAIKNFMSNKAIDK